MAISNEKELKKKFEQFFILTYPKVKAFAWKILKTEADAEDIAQDIFVKLWNNPEIWENQETWNSYIYTMAKNHIFNFLKHENIKNNYIEQNQSNLDNNRYIDYYNETITDEIHRKEINLLIQMAINQMPPQRKTVFLMSRYDGLSNAEIAEKLNLSVRTVERHIYLALTDLKKIILIIVFSFFH